MLCPPLPGGLSEEPWGPLRRTLGLQGDCAKTAELSYCPHLAPGETDLESPKDRVRVARWRTSVSSRRCAQANGGSNNHNNRENHSQAPRVSLGGALPSAVTCMILFLPHHSPVTGYDDSCFTDETTRPREVVTLTKVTQLLRSAHGTGSKVTGLQNSAFHGPSRWLLPRAQRSLPAGAALASFPAFSQENPGCFGWVWF